MNCEEIRRHWDLYHDSEGEAEVHWQINAHLDACPGCAEWFARQSRFESRLSQRLATGDDASELWRAALESAGVARRASVSMGAKGRSWGGRLAWAAGLLAALGLLGWGLADRLGGDPSLSRIAARRHADWLDGAMPAAFRSESDTAVEDFLRGAVAFPVRCPPRGDSGFQVQGADTCRLADQAAAVVFGRVEDAAVSVFILSRESLARFPHQRAALRGASPHRCREGNLEMALGLVDQNVVLVVGRVDGAKLERVLRAYGSYPHAGS